MSFYPPANSWQGPGGGISYEEFGAQPGMQRPAAGGPTAFNDMFTGATSVMATRGLAAYGNKFLGSGRDYVQSNISKLGNLHVYFQVNSQYVKNKLKILLFPFLHKGHWTRLATQMGGGEKLTYKPPNEDINAPDLYLPCMAFGTYMILCGIALGVKGQFGPEVLSSRCTRALVAWGAQVLLVRSILYTLGSNSPLLDIISYTGYSFVGVSLNILARMGSLWAYYAVLTWTTISLDVFLVKTLKRILFAEARSYDRDSSRHHYMLLLIAVFQFPVAIGLGLL